MAATKAMVNPAVETTANKRSARMGDKVRLATATAVVT